jgi:hypothetical protein
MSRLLDNLANKTHCSPYASLLAPSLLIKWQRGRSSSYLSIQVQESKVQRE